MRSFTLLSILFFLTINLSGQTYIMDGNPIDDCDGSFVDSGGNSGNYSSNENITTTICPDGSTGTHIRLTFSAAQLAAGDALCFFDGPDATAPQIACAADFPGAFIIQATAENLTGCVTVTFVSDASVEDAGWSAEISCIASCQTIIATLTSTDPVVMPVDTGYIDICVGDRVFFNAIGVYPQDGLVYNHSDATSDFSWNFGDGTVALGPNTSHIFNEPGGYVVELLIEDTLGCTSTNFISQRVRVSTFPDFQISGDFSGGLCVGDTINLSAVVSSIDTTYEVSVQPTQGSFTGVGALSDTLLLPDGSGVSYQTSIGFASFSPGATLTNADDILGITLFLEHSYGGDLDIEVICPNGQSTYILDFPSGVGSTNFGEPYATSPVDGMSGDLTPGIPYEYTFVNSGATYGTLPDAAGNFNYTYTTVPSNTSGNTSTYNDNYFPAGTYLPVETFDNLLGCPLNGEWTIRVQDNLGADNGWLFRWEIGFNEILYANAEVFQPVLLDWAWDDNSTIISATPDSITAVLGYAGTTNYTFAVTDDFGCTYDTTIIANVLPPTHPDCFSCGDITPVLSDTVLCTGEVATISGSGDTPLGNQVVAFGASSYTEFDGDVHPPGNPIESVINISNVNPTTLTDPLTQLASVCVNIQHKYDADVEIRLRAPNGTIIELSTDNGGSGDDYTNACFTPTAVTPVTSGAAPFTGDWIPEGDWNDLVGTNITGVWTLLVADDQNGFDGEFLEWNISFNSVNEVTYSWSPSTDLSCDDCSDPVASPSQTTDYILNVTDAYGCIGTDTMTVIVLDGFPAPILNCGTGINGDLTISWADISGAPAYEVSFDGGMTWIPANGLLSHTVSGLVDGDVVDILVQVDSDDTNCPILSSSIQCPYLDPCAFILDTISTANPSCWNTTDGAVFLSSTGGQQTIMYNVDNGVPSTTPSFSDLTAGIHTAYAVDGVGCSDSITFELFTVDSIILDIVTDSASCFGICDGIATVTGTGGTGAITYTWNTTPLTNGPVASNLCAGTYTVTATDVNGCFVEASVTIEEPQELMIGSVTPMDVACFGELTGEVTVAATGGTAPYFYQWDDAAAQTTPTADGLGTGMFNVVVTDSKGCMVNGSGMVDGPASAVSIAVAQTFVGCADGQGSIAEVNAMGGDENFSYEWSNGDLINTASNLDDILYSVTVTDGAGCSVEDNLQITELDPISAALTGVDPTCFDGTNGEVSIGSVIGGTGTYFYSWDLPALPTGSTIDNLQGDNTYTVFVTDDQGCQGTASFSLGEPAEIIMNLGSTEPSCNGFVDGQATIQGVQGGVPNFSYQWSNNAGNQVTETAIDLASGTYSVTITDNDGCTASSEIIVEEPTTMELAIQTDNVDCPGESGGSITVNTLGGVPSYTYNWNNGDDTPTIENISSGDYTVTVTDANGCFVVESVAIVSPAPLVGDVIITDVSCFGEDDGRLEINMIGGTPPYRYSSDNINFNGANVMIRLETGDYSLFVEDANGCTWNSNAFVDTPEEFVVDAGPEAIEIILGDSVQFSPNQFNGNGFVNFEWTQPYFGTLHCDTSYYNLDCNQPFAGPLVTTTYELFGYDAAGCEDSDLITVRVIKPRDVYVATGFTPNDDGKNDLLMLHGPDNVIVRSYRVFDRWGNLVFEYEAVPGDFEDLIKINNELFGWDGKFKEEPMNPGVYLWSAEVEYIDGYRKVFKGNTTLIR